MKARFFKAFAAFLTIAALLVPAFALAAARYPAQSGALLDDANALSDAMAKELSEFAETADDEANVKVHIALVHFLDGLDAQTYANNLFARWELGEDDFLLLGAVGEDAFASASGKDVKEKFSDSNAQSLLFSSGFSELFKAQQYDAAFAKYFLRFADMLNKKFDAGIDTDELFPDYQEKAQQPAATQKPSATAEDYGSALWTSVIDSIGDSVDQYQNYQHQRNTESSSGLNGRGWLVLGVIILIIFSQSDPVRKARRGGKSGCGPLGWILTGFGLHSLFGRKHRP